MQCPKCRQPLSSVPVAEGECVERCTNCFGIVCSDGALVQLQRQWFFWPTSDLQAIDAGRPADGKRWNELRAVACPTCESPMTMVTASGPLPLELDRCGPCRLTFFDAGEMTDLRYRTLADWARDCLCSTLGA